MSAELLKELDDLQGLLVHGYGQLEGATFALCKVDDGCANDARAFLASLEVTDVPTARRASQRQQGGPPQEPFVNVAFTYAGLCALHLDAKLLDSFPRAFVEGLCTEPRARMLGDVDGSHPSKWLWGGLATEPIHVAFLIYATPANIGLHETIILNAAAAAGIKKVQSQPPSTLLLPRRQEHFGFRDGIGQPMIDGAWDKPDNPGDLVAPGEILLGHADAFGGTSYVPTGQKKDRTFARNGSYMVLRQLEQDVARFWRFCRGHASSDAEAIRLASRMVGRWPSGAPLISYDAGSDPGPHARVRCGGPEAQDDNDFLYASDPRGLLCPLGSHIRRSNPRDALSSDAAESIKITGRHRMIRRGRAYGKPLCEDAEPASYLRELERASEQGTDRGLHFVCFSASLERGFEFVQQQWCENPKLSGAMNGSDPLIGSQQAQAAAPPSFTLPAPSRQPARRLSGLQRYVHVRGGGYFFLPSISGVRSLATR